MKSKRVLVLGVTGMLGHTIFKFFFEQKNIDVYGTMRSSAGLKYFDQNMQKKILSNIDLINQDDMVRAFMQTTPDIVINCVGIIKQLSIANDPLAVLPVNAMLPHRLARLCRLIHARLIHISTDCVFSGKKGVYSEDDSCDATDLYGVSKKIGEIIDVSSVVTLRTSIIGHELNSNFALVDWFLSQKSVVQGYKKAIFSGLPTVELAEVILRYVIPNESLFGLYHVSAEPIDKHTLLSLINKEYQKNIDILDNDVFEIDRSLDSTKFKRATGYSPPLWTSLISKMKEMGEGRC